MATTKKRINISLSSALEDALAKIAKRDKVPQATKATELIMLALELEEDQVWDALAKARDTKKTRLVSHEDAWV